LAKTLKKQTIEGFGWRGATDILEQVLQIVFTAILARLLSKADFGLIAMALLINRFFQTVTNIGFGGAIIRSQTVTREQISAVFYIQLALNLVLSIIIFSGANIAAGFFNEEKLVQIIRVTAWVIFLQTFQFPNILLQKQMDFKRFSLMEIISMVSANLLAILLAFAGYGYWALVWRLLAQRAVFSALTWGITKWRPGKPDFKGTKPLLTFGLNMLGSNIFYYFSENLIGIITGKFLGKEIMGLFNIAYNLAIVPASKVQNILASVLMPGFAKIQGNIKSFVENNQKALKYTSLVFIPFMFLMAGISDNLIITLYGLKWSDAGFMLFLLSFVGIMKGIAHLLRSAILAKGHAQVVFYAAIIETLSSIPIMYYTIKSMGIYGLISGYMTGSFFGLVYTIYSYNKLFEGKSFFIGTISKPVLIGAALLSIAWLCSFIDAGHLLLLIIQVSSGLVLYAITVSFLYNIKLKEVIAEIKSHI